jgi:hypothetical protein
MESNNKYTMFHVPVVGLTQHAFQQPLQFDSISQSSAVFTDIEI